MKDAVGIAGRVGMVGLKRHDVVRQHLDGAVGRLVAAGVERTEGVRRSPAARNPGQRHQGVTPMRQQPEDQKQHVGTQEHGKGQPRARLHRMAHRVDMGAVGTEHHAAHHRQIGGHIGGVRDGGAPDHHDTGRREDDRFSQSELFRCLLHMIRLQIKIIRGTKHRKCLFILLPIRHRSMPPLRCCEAPPVPGTAGPSRCSVRASKCLRSPGRNSPRSKTGGSPRDT